MEIEESNRAQKRKNRPAELDTQGDSEEKIMRPPKLRPRIGSALLDDEQGNDTLIDSSQKAPTTGDGGVAQSSGTDEEKSKKAGRSKKHKCAIDPEEAERKILAATGAASEFLNEDLLLAMTALDISAQALEYLEHIEMIRVKSGRLQGGLSGELKIGRPA